MVKRRNFRGTDDERPGPMIKQNERGFQIDDMAADQRGFFAAGIVNLVFGLILTLLALRFVLRLLGANPAHDFASLVYGLSQPLVAPFFGLFRYQAELSTSNFEVATLIALIVYALIAGLLSRVLFADRRRV